MGDIRKDTAKKKQQKLIICAAIVVCCLLMALVDGYLRPPYAVKAAGKVVLFLGVPLLYSRLVLCQDGPGGMVTDGILSVLRPDKKALILGLALGAGTMLVILGGYALLSPWLDLSAIPAAMAANGGITADNFLWVGSYIALCNSLLEEIFFRGFAFLMLKKVSSRRFAYVASAAGFSLYHAAIVDGWVSPLLFGLMLTALFVCGLFFNWLDERRERIWVAWLMHACANVAINAIGMVLLGMI